MAIIFDHYMKDKVVKEVVTDDEWAEKILGSLVNSKPKAFGKNGTYQFEEELMFSVFHHLSSKSFASLLEKCANLEKECNELKLQKEAPSKQQIEKVEEDKKILIIKHNKLVKKYRTCEEEIKDLKMENDRISSLYAELCEETVILKQQIRESKYCKTCLIHEEKYDYVINQLKKCAFIVNSSIESEGNVLKRVRSILHHAVMDISNKKTDETVVKGSPIRAPTESGFCSNMSVMLAPETQLPSTDNVDKPLSQSKGLNFNAEREFITVIPETAPFDLFSDEEQDPQLINTQKFFQSKTAPCSPVVLSTIAPQLDVTPVKKPPSEGAELLNDESYYSPCLMDLPVFARPTEATNLVFPEIAKLKIAKNEDDVEEEEDIPNLNRKKLYELTERKPIVLKKADRPVFAEKKSPPNSPPSTPLAKKSKMKQTKLTTFTAPGQPRPAMKMKIAPPNELREPMRKRRGKEPEDWPCKKCYKLLIEAEASGKIDRRRHEISMNFCQKHFNRTSYYLGTPPGFWDCNKMGEPRNGHLHPLNLSEENENND